MLNPKLETLNSKQTQMFKIQSSELYDIGIGEAWGSPFEYLDFEFGVYLGFSV
jgi:hypothetical protein